MYERRFICTFHTDFHLTSGGKSLPNAVRNADASVLIHLASGKDTELQLSYKD